MCQIQQQTFCPEKDGGFKTFHFGLYVFVKGPPPSFPPSAPAMPVQPSAPPPAGPGGSSTATTYSSSSSHSSSYSSHSSSYSSHSSSSSVSSSSSTKVLRNMLYNYIYWVELSIKARTALAEVGFVCWSKSLHQIMQSWYGGWGSCFLLKPKAKGDDTNINVLGYNKRNKK